MCVQVLGRCSTPFLQAALLCSARWLTERTGPEFGEAARARGGGGLAVVAAGVAAGHAAVRAAADAAGGHLAGLHVQLLLLRSVQGHVHVAPLLRIPAAQHLVRYLSAANGKSFTYPRVPQLIAQ